jgi:glycosyltransferase involved in cell wall biosynthesis
VLVTVPYSESRGAGGPRPLKVLQVGTLNEGGGAASIARSLSEGLQVRGHRAWLAVGRRSGSDPSVFQIPDERRAGYRVTGYTALQRALGARAGSSPGRGWGLIGRLLRLATHPRALAARFAGHEDFGFSGTRDLLGLPPVRPDIVHCHNLHGDFFDLGALSWLSREIPTVLTLHDSWLLTGHCAHSFECDRWIKGCGSCPDLSIYPSIRRDGTAANWTRKRDIYAGSRLYVTTPSSWLMDRVGRSMLWPAAELSRVIPNGVDQSIFKPGDQSGARRELGIPPGGPVVLFMSGRHEQPWTDHAALATAIKLISDSHRSVAFISLGGESNPRVSRGAQVIRAPYQTDPHRMAMYYQASDVFLHCARVATSPVSILESLACGTPVAASAVGGIPEQIRPLASSPAPTGVLVNQSDAAAMARAVVSILDDENLKRQLGDNGVRDVRARFDRITQLNAYIEWYRTIIDHWNTHVSLDRATGSAVAAEPVALAVD